MVSSIFLLSIGINWFGIVAPILILSLCLYKFGYSVKAFLSFIGLLVFFFVISDFASKLV